MSVTVECDTLTETVTEHQSSVTVERDTLACARPYSVGECHGVTLPQCVTVERDVTVRVEGQDQIALRAQGVDGSLTRDSDSTPARGDAITVTPAETVKDRQMARLVADPRFAGWVAGSAK